jgi:prepilin-type N-terminal cleavage/methylation domain-containing protein
MKKMKNIRKAGFTLVEIMIVVAIIGLLAAIAIPNFIKARSTSQANACLNNLRQIDGGEQQWALETHQVSSNVPATVVALVSGGFVRTPGGNANGPTCPAGGNYITSSTLAAQPTITCTYSTGVTPQHKLQ